MTADKKQWWTENSQQPLWLGSFLIYSIILQVKELVFPLPHTHLQFTANDLKFRGRWQTDSLTFTNFQKERGKKEKHRLPGNELLIELLFKTTIQPSNCIQSDSCNILQLSHASRRYAGRFNLLKAAVWGGLGPAKV